MGETWRKPSWSGLALIEDLISDQTSSEALAPTFMTLKRSNKFLTLDTVDEVGVHFSDENILVFKITYLFSHFSPSQKAYFV